MKPLQLFILAAGTSILLIAGGCGYSLPSSRSARPRGPAVTAATTSPRAPSRTFGVPTALLQLGREQGAAAKETYLGDERHQAVVRALDKRVEAWERRRLTYLRLERGPAGRREVLLTFDDGPDPVVTPQVLELLRRFRVPAVFFVIGRRAAAHPQLLRREAREGHVIGNHTWDHLYLTRMEPPCMRAQVEATRNAIRAITGRTTPWFRPPGGHHDPDVARVCRDLGQVMVLWSDPPGDWLEFASPGGEPEALRALRPGSILLLHDTLPDTPAILPRLIATVRRRGFRFVSIERFHPAIQARE